VIDLKISSCCISTRSFNRASLRSHYCVVGAIESHV
jgi:hypothetical protein